MSLDFRPSPLPPPMIHGTRGVTNNEMPDINKPILYMKKGTEA